MYGCFACESFSPFDFEKNGQLWISPHRRMPVVNYNPMLDWTSWRKPLSAHGTDGFGFPLRKSLLFFGKKSRDATAAPPIDPTDPQEPRKSVKLLIPLFWQRGIQSAKLWRYSFIARIGRVNYFGAGIGGNAFAMEHQIYLRLSRRTGVREAVTMEKFSADRLECDFERDMFRDGAYLGTQRDVTNKYTTYSIAFLTDFLLCSLPLMGSPFYCFLGGGPCYVDENMDCNRRNSWESNTQQEITVKGDKWLCLLSGGVGATLIQIGPINLGVESRLQFIINDYSHKQSIGTDNAPVSKELSIGLRIQY
jgi:hypothetical protein